MKIDRLHNSFCLFILILAGMILYSNTLYVPWYLDDTLHISDHSTVQDLGKALRNIAGPRGVALFTFALNYHFGGLALPGYHLVNIAIHITTAILVFLLLKRVFHGSLFFPLTAALIFIAHPLQTQAVTYVVQRMTSLCALLFFGSLYLFVRAREIYDLTKKFLDPEHITYYLFSILCGSLAALTKENAVILPFAILLFDRFFLSDRDRKWRKKLLYIAPYLIVPSLLVCQQLIKDASIFHNVSGARYWSESASEIRLPVDSSLPADPSLSANTPENLPVTYLVTEFTVIWEYIRLLFLPFGQTLDYAYPLVDSLIALQNIAALLGLVLLLFAAFYFGRDRNKRLISFGILWFFLALSVESTIIPLDPLFEHRLYIPMFGFVCVMPGCLRLLAGKRIMRYTICFIILLFSALTWQRNDLWADPIAFLTDNVRKAPHNDRAHNNLGNAYLERGDFTRAIKAYNRAIELNPKFAKAFYNLGNAYHDRGDFMRAIKGYDRAIELNPKFAAVYYNRGKAHGASGNYKQALKDFNIVIKLRPEYSEAYNNRGICYYSSGNIRQAINDFKRAIELDPQNAEAYYNLSQMYSNSGDIGEARIYYKKAADLGLKQAQPRLTDVR